MKPKSEFSRKLAADKVLAARCSALTHQNRHNKEMNRVGIESLPKRRGRPLEPFAGGSRQGGWAAAGHRSRQNAQRLDGRGGAWLPENVRQGNQCWIIFTNQYQTPPTHGKNRQNKIWCYLCATITGCQRLFNKLPHPRPAKAHFQPRN